ncbi:uncharacterized protein LOC133391130 isoform X2 [Anopheles gambiae]|uniref:uncharacterized protein LOC133391130 isoform X2 n=1 Tax=Anopheles gambiae TaxID=7165 RepID=UPI002AC979CF|nr:uncharacterized protein LOC133391130 isoform X2 [Anopheles gambiae]
MNEQHDPIGILATIFGTERLEDLVALSMMLFGVASIFILALFNLSRFTPSYSKLCALVHVLLAGFGIMMLAFGRVLYMFVYSDTMSIARFLIYGMELLTIVILGFQCLLDRCKRLQYKVRVEGRVTRVRADLAKDLALARGGSFTRSCQTSPSAFIPPECDRPVAAVRRSGRLPITTATTLRMPALADGGTEPGMAKLYATSPAVPPAVAGPSKPRPTSSIREATELGPKPKRPIVFPRTSFLDTDSSTEEGGTVVQTRVSVHPVPAPTPTEVPFKPSPDGEFVSYKTSDGYGKAKCLTLPDLFFN